MLAVNIEKDHAKQIGNNVYIYIALFFRKVAGIRAGRAGEGAAARKSSGEGRALPNRGDAANMR